MNEPILLTRNPSALSSSEGRDSEVSVTSIDSTTDHADRVGAIVRSVGNYSVLSELGRGSYGAVYLVEDRHQTPASPSPTPEQDRNSETSSSCSSPIPRQRYAMKVVTETKKTNRRATLRESALRRPSQAVKNAAGTTTTATATATPLSPIAREIAIMKQLSHPNIVHLVACIREESPPYSMFIVVDFCEAGPVMTQVENDNNESGKSEPITPPPPPPPSLQSQNSTEKQQAEPPRNSAALGPRFVSPITETVIGEALCSTLMSQIVSAMEYLHAHGIAHRDLKPDNILCDFDDHIKIIDFGVSHLFDKEGEDKREGSGHWVYDTAGTWLFWSPEMVEGSQSTAEPAPYDAYKADVWAAGICMWIMLFGSLPYYGELPMDIFQKISQPVLPPLPHRLSAECESFLRTLLTIDPETRPSFHELKKHPFLNPSSLDMGEGKGAVTVNGTAKGNLNKDVRHDGVSSTNSLQTLNNGECSSSSNRLSLWEEGCCSRSFEPTDEELRGAVSSAEIVFGSRVGPKLKQWAKRSSISAQKRRSVHKEKSEKEISVKMKMLEERIKSTRDFEEVSSNENDGMTQGQNSGTNSSDVEVSNEARGDAIDAQQVHHQSEPSQHQGCCVIS